MIASLASHRANDLIAANFRAAVISERLYGEAAPEIRARFDGRVILVPG